MHDMRLTVALMEDVFVENSDWYPGIANQIWSPKSLTNQISEHFYGFKRHGHAILNASCMRPGQI